MYTFKQMINATPRNIIMNASHVLLLPFKSSESTDEQGQFSYYLYHGRDKDGMRKVQIKIYNGRYTWIHCDCPWFQYNCEVALSLKNSSSLINSNGQVSKTTNPMMKPLLCKHAYRSIMDLMTRKLI